MTTVRTGSMCSLRAKGYTVLPSPRHAEIGEETVRLDSGWQIALPDAVESGDVAVRSLRAGLERLCVGNPGATVGARGTITLCIRPGAVDTGVADGRHDDAYRLEITPRHIDLTANDRPGLFYAVQTLLQLAEGNGGDPGVLPAGRIEDWPEHEVRCLHWDTKHHQSRPETLRRYLDQAAQFKINAIIYELEDKFAYPSHPVIGAPGAWIPDELQSLVDYALARHIQIIPDIQSPAHLAYVLKHEEFAHLRCDGSNYQICMDDPEARRLLFDMYDDVCAATKGCRYFLVSTDEVYYAGICEKYRQPYNPQNRSLTWVDYVNAAHAHLAKQGQRVIVWAEYPLLPEHVSLLPADLLSGVGPAGAEMQAALDRRGIGQFAYMSMQGEELLFPDNFSFTDRDGLAQPGRLQQACEAVRGAHHRMPRCIGTIGAAWDDSGLHSETFWLGWGVAAQGSWNPGAEMEDTVASFLALHHGREAEGMEQVCRDLQSGARFYERSLERLPANVRGPAYGNSRAKRPVHRTDLGMQPPALPDPATFAVEPVFRTRYAAALAEIPARLAENDRLQRLLESNLSRVRRNRHAIEVFLSIAWLQRQHLSVMQAAAAAEGMLEEAAAHAAGGKRAEAVVLLRLAAARARQAAADLESTGARVRAVWEQGRFSKGQAVGGREFVHVMDDVKDHVADRTADLRYLIAPDLRIGLAEWATALERIILGQG